MLKPKIFIQKKKKKLRGLINIYKGKNLVRESTKFYHMAHSIERIEILLNYIRNKNKFKNRTSLFPLIQCFNTNFVAFFIQYCFKTADDAEKFTSEMHDPCARSRCLQERTTQKTPSEGTGVEPTKHPSKVKLEMFLQL